MTAQIKKEGTCISCNCSQCFQEMFFSIGRTFNCIYSTYSYVCRYIYQYSSEILHLLYHHKFIFISEKGEQRQDNINILSIGCGPCSEIFAFNSFLKYINYTGNISFCGFDICSEWKSIHSKISSLIPFNIDFHYENCIRYIGDTQNYQYPNILILNYVLSDICKNGDINEFINNITNNLIDKMPAKSIIIINDINHYNPRYFYNELIKKIKHNNNIGYNCLHFIGYQYGQKYKYNNIFFSLGQKNLSFLQKKYNTKTICSSAQLIIFKKNNK